MTPKTIIKIKDSIDLFLSDNYYLTVYYINSRKRKNFRINEEMVHLLEEIDGKKSIEDLMRLMENQYAINPPITFQTINALQKKRIITEVIDSQSFISDTLLQRYTRQINYFTEFLGSELEGIAAQKKLIDSHIVLFGCGAVGGNIAIQLAMSGVSNFTLYDYDITENSDTSRHLFYRNKYHGIKKTEALKQELLLINSDIKVTIESEFMNPKTNIENIIQKATCVVNTLDEPYIGYTASKISRSCIKYNIPHYIAGGFDAHLASTGELIIPYITPCVECYASHFKESLKGWKPKKHPIEERYTKIGGLASMTLFSSSYACIEIIKYITGLIEMQNNYQIRGEFLFHNMTLTYLDVKKNPECPICGGEKNES